ALQGQVVAGETRVVDQQDVPVVHVRRQVGDVLVPIDLGDLDQVFRGLPERPALVLEAQLRQVDVGVRLRGGALGQAPKRYLDEGHATRSEEHTSELQSP